MASSSHASNTLIYTSHILNGRNSAAVVHVKVL